MVNSNTSTHNEVNSAQPVYNLDSDGDTGEATNLLGHKRKHRRRGKQNKKSKNDLNTAIDDKASISTKNKGSVLSENKNNSKSNQTITTYTLPPRPSTQQPLGNRHVYK